MLSKIAVVASLLMLSEGAIEVLLTKVSSLSNKHFSSASNYLQRDPMVLEGGTATVYRSYIAEITIGNKNYRLIADTGSSDLLVVGENCVTYEPGATCDPQTSPIGYCNTGGSAKSNSGTYVGKDGSNCYGIPGAITFAKYDLYKANVTMAGVQAHDQYLGYIHQQTVGMWGEGTNAVDGILGLAYDGLSSIYEVTNGAGKTLMSTLSSENGIPNAIAMCFDPSGTGGKMVVGGGELANMQFTPLILESWYTISMSSMSIGDRTLSYIAGLETIVDSGTTNLIVPGQVLEDFASQLCPLLAQMGSPCLYNQNYQQYVPQVISVTPDQLSTLPDITISLPGVTLIVSPQAYFIYFGITLGKQNKYVYGIASNGYYQSPAGNVAVILGDVALMGYWVYFDMANSRVGFSSVKHCNQRNIESTNLTLVQHAAQKTKENGALAPYSIISIWASVFLSVIILIGV